MDSKILQRVMDLAEKTGDRVIVVNPLSGRAHAVVPFASYEKLVKNQASLRDLEDERDYSDDLDDFDEDFEIEDEEECPICKATGINLDDLDDDKESIATEDDEIPSVEELNRISEEALKDEKKPEQSRKIADDLAPLDVLEDEENEEQYYLEPLE